MTRSMCHKNYRDILSHYLCPLHLLAPILKYALRTRSKTLRIILFQVIKGYDCLYRLIFVTP